MNKKELIKLRCTGLEKAILQKKADNSGQSLSSFVRSAALGHKIGYKLTDEELEAYQMLTKYHNNFVAIINLLKKKDSNFAKEVMRTADEIKEHLKKFR
ncbi:MAG TPA: hypothetical protein VFD29_08070 [Gillisia sp.]|nr:hypothetical protein [Gillisia sp.]